MKKIDETKKFLIVGLGLIGGSYATALKKKGFYVSAITKNQEDIRYAYLPDIFDFLILMTLISQGLDDLYFHGLR